MFKIPFFTKALLMQMVNEKRASINVSQISKLAEDGKYPVGRHMMHGDTEIRCEVILQENPYLGTHVSPSIELFNQLPVIIGDDKGNITGFEDRYDMLSFGVLHVGMLMKTPPTDGEATAGTDDSQDDQEVEADEEEPADDEEDGPSDIEVEELPDGRRCVECAALFDPEQDELGPALYECGNCGEEYNRDNSSDGASHRCPSCNKFGSKKAEESCPDCTGSELENVTIYRCGGDGGCGELHETEEAAQTCCASKE